MSEPTRIVIAGAGGRLGAALAREYAGKYEVRGLGRDALDLGRPEQMQEVVDSIEFDLFINCAAQTNVDRCEREPEEAFAINARAPGLLGKICAAKGAQLLHISTDYVFAGDKTEPYTEEDEAKPISVYGQSKLEGEEAVLEASPGHLVVRVSWVFGPDRPSFVDWVIEQARTKESVAAIADKYSTPSYTLDLAQMLESLWNPRVWSRSAPGPEADGTGGATSFGPRAGRLHGVFHLTNRGQCSWRDYGQWALECCRAEGIPLRARGVEASALAEMKQFVARRPVHSILATEKFERATGHMPRPWQEAVRDYVRDHVAHR